MPDDLQHSVTRHLQSVSQQLDVAPHDLNAIIRNARRRTSRRRQLGALTVATTIGLVVVGIAAVRPTHRNDDHAETTTMPTTAPGITTAVPGVTTTTFSTSTTPQAPVDGPVSVVSSTRHWTLVDTPTGVPTSRIWERNGKLYSWSPRMAAPGAEVGDSHPDTLYSSVDGVIWTTENVGDLTTAHFVGVDVNANGIYLVGFTGGDYAPGLSSTLINNPNGIVVRHVSSNGSPTDFPIPIDFQNYRTKDLALSASASIAAGLYGVIIGVTIHNELDMRKVLPADVDATWGASTNELGVAIHARPTSLPADVGSDLCPLVPRDNKANYTTLSSPQTLPANADPLSFGPYGAPVCFDAHGAVLGDVKRSLTWAQLEFSPEQVRSLSGINRVFMLSATELVTEIDNLPNISNAPYPVPHITATVQSPPRLQVVSDQSGFHIATTFTTANQQPRSIGATSPTGVGWKAIDFPANADLGATPFGAVHGGLATFGRGSNRESASVAFLTYSDEAWTTHDLSRGLNNSDRAQGAHNVTSASFDINRVGGALYTNPNNAAAHPIDMTINGLTLHTDSDVGGTELIDQSTGEVIAVFLIFEVGYPTHNPLVVVAGPQSNRVINVSDASGHLRVSFSVNDWQKQVSKVFNKPKMDRATWSLFDTQDGITWHVISADDAAGQRVYGVGNTYWLAGKFFAVVALNPDFNDDGTPRAQRYATLLGEGQ